jgi:spectinomycin phosphotransferase
MLEEPDLPADAIAAVLRDTFGLRGARVTFLPLGWADNAVYRVTAAGGASYFLKLRRGDVDAIAVAVPAFLRAQGIRPVMAPVATTTGALWTRRHGFAWILYPFFDGRTGFEAALSKAQWVVLGASMRAVHATRLPAALGDRVPREDYSPRRRDVVRAFHGLVARGRRHDDTIAESLAAFWSAKRDEIDSIVERAELLASVLRQRTPPPVLCHADLHGRNVLVRGDDEVAIVDWDEPILAPKERDLMFIGGGVGGIWNDARETRWFYGGYGRVEIDPVALSYYRYERIVVDIAACAERIFGGRGSVEERRKGLALANQFLPNNVVDIAHRTYRRLARRPSGIPFRA